MHDFAMKTLIYLISHINSFYMHQHEISMPSDLLLINWVKIIYEFVSYVKLVCMT